MSGNASECVAVVTANGRSLPALMYVIEAEVGDEHDMHLSAEQVGERRCRAAIWHVHHIDSGHHLEQFARHMAYGPVAGRCHTDLAGLLLGMGNELVNRWGSEPMDAPA